MDKKTTTTKTNRREQIKMAEKELLSASQVAALMGDKWSRQRVHTERSRGTFPEPARIIEMRSQKIPLWTPEQIASEKRKRGIGDEK